MKSSMIRLTILGSAGLLIVNILLLSRQGVQFGWPEQQQPQSAYIRIGSDFFSSFAPVEETVSHHALQRKKSSSAAEGAASASAISSSMTTTTTTTMTTSRLTTAAAASVVGNDGSVNESGNGRTLNDGDKPPLRYSKTLMGIFTSDSYNDSSYRKRHRTLLQMIWKDPRTCTLAEYRRRPDIRDRCELIYTFIIGGSQNPEAPTERYENRPEVDLPIVLDRMANPSRDDINVDDVTILNIRYVV